jgi:hypothetical protein
LFANEWHDFSGGLFGGTKDNFVLDLVDISAPLAPQILTWGKPPGGSFCVSSALRAVKLVKIWHGFLLRAVRTN